MGSIRGEVRKFFSLGSGLASSRQSRPPWPVPTKNEEILFHPKYSSPLPSRLRIVSHQSRIVSKASQAPKNTPWPPPLLQPLLRNPKRRHRGKHACPRHEPEPILDREPVALPHQHPHRGLQGLDVVQALPHAGHDVLGVRAVFERVAEIGAEGLLDDGGAEGDADDGAETAEEVGAGGGDGLVFGGCVADWVIMSVE